MSDQHVPPRVMLIEDDAAVCRFVHAALEPLDVECIDCAGESEALAAIATQQFDLLLVDLMLREGSGLSFIERLLAPMDAPRPTPVVVYSGGLHAAVREQLLQWGVARCLSKPASAAELREAVAAVLDVVHWPQAPEHGAALAGLNDQELAAVETYFDGDRDFYESYRSSCLEQFTIDIQTGDLACESGDAVALRRVVHSLKSVLQTLGYADHSVCARALEETVQREPFAVAQAGWIELRGRLQRSFRLV